MLFAAVVRAHDVVDRELEDALLLFRGVVKAAVLPRGLVLVGVAGIILLSVVQRAGTGALRTADCLALSRRTEVRSVESVTRVTLRSVVPFAVVHAPQFVLCG